MASSRGVTNNTIRFTGMASNLDTEAIVNASLLTDKAKIDKIDKKQQLAEWKQEKYRELINKLRDFNKSYLDVTSSTNMTSRSTYKVLAGKVRTSTGADSTLFSIKGNADALAGNYSIKVKQRAKAGAIQTEKLSGESPYIDSISFKAGEKYTVTVDGVIKEVTIDSFTAPPSGTVQSLEDRLKDSLQNNLDTQFGIGSKTADVKTINGTTIVSIEDTTTNEINDYKVDSLDIGASYTINVDSKTINAQIDPQTHEEAVMSSLNNAYGFSTSAGFAVENGKIVLNGESTSFGIKSVKDIEYNKNQIGGNFNVTVNGRTELISVTGTTDDDREASFKTQLNSKFSGMNFEVKDGKITFSGSNTAVKITGTGITNEQSNIYTNTSRIDKNASISTIADKLGMVKDATSGTYTFKIGNGATNYEFKFNANDKISTVLSVINSEEAAGVSMTYDEITDKITITSKKTGSSYLPVIYGASNDDSTDGKVGSAYFKVSTQAQDAQVVFNGKSIIYDSNDLTINGVTISLLRDPTVDEINETQTAELSLDTDKIYENIKKIVDSYNELITSINTALNEKYDRDYQPLTDEEKEAMSDDEVKLWEQKAKKGILRRDSLLQSIVTEMRAAMYASIKDVSGGIYNIGITTSEVIEDYGKLIIDEDELKKNIKNNPDKIMDIFAKESEIYRYKPTLTSSERKQRYNESGIMIRISDIIQDNITTLRDSNDRKGKLIEKAGIEEDASEFSNSITKEINDYKAKIKSLWKLYTEREERLYKKYTALETAMSKINSQSNSLSSMLGLG